MVISALQIKDRNTKIKTKQMIATQVIDPFSVFSFLMLNIKIISITYV